MGLWSRGATVCLSVRCISRPLRCSPTSFKLSSHLRGAVPNRRAFTSSHRLTMAALQRSALLEAIQAHDPDSTAVVHSLSGRSFTYGSLLQDVATAKETLLQETGRDDHSIVGERIALLVENSYDYVGAPSPSTQPHSTVERVIDDVIQSPFFPSWPPTP